MTLTDCQSPSVESTQVLNQSPRPEHAGRDDRQAQDDGEFRCVRSGGDRSPRGRRAGKTGETALDDCAVGELASGEPGLKTPSRRKERTELARGRVGEVGQGRGRPVARLPRLQWSQLVSQYGGTASQPARRPDGTIPRGDIDKQVRLIRRVPSGLRTPQPPNPHWSTPVRWLAKSPRVTGCRSRDCSTPSEGRSSTSSKAVCRLGRLRDAVSRPPMLVRVRQPLPQPSDAGRPGQPSRSQRRTPGKRSLQPAPDAGHREPAQSSPSPPAATGASSATTSGRIPTAADAVSPSSATGLSPGRGSAARAAAAASPRCTHFLAAFQDWDPDTDHRRRSGARTKC